MRPRSIAPILPLAAAMLLAACGPLPPRESPAPPQRPSSAPPRPAPAGGWPRTPAEASGPAVLALLDQAAAQPAAQAEATLERALRIEPRNPFVWQALAGVRLQQGMADDAETAAQKSTQLAGGNPWVESGNWRAIAAARRARGDEPGAQEAEQRASVLQEQLGQ
ncbi:MAG TPA: hypothetical protein VM369_06795 [Candidatus Binatia bacterium]|nr:hypothetical protein [Candidatus Binatia bacterium]